jgi:2-polyprenyl-3-methyl-5-hydroxy-6-metoxy-1,4-benzoquinol methylase
MTSSSEIKIPLRTLQYVAILKLASELLGLNLLNGCGKRALDVGCGSGNGLLALKLLGYEVYGFDVDGEKLRKARELGFNALQYDAEVGVPFNEDFNLVTCFSVLEHLRHPEKALISQLKSPMVSY